ncbi:MAG: hypothetical protein BroJett038_33250 [Chloroflexota bacterium]|nr:MAG: hypothetical protein BroJett038_33250 [Chloroflexota bacterium]
MPVQISPELLAILNTVIANKGGEPLASVCGGSRLREDLGFDSLDLAELTARIDHRFHVDVFAQGVVAKIGEVQDLIDRQRG